MLIEVVVSILVVSPMIILGLLFTVFLDKSWEWSNRYMENVLHRPKQKRTRWSDITSYLIGGVLIVFGVGFLLLMLSTIFRS